MVAAPRFERLAVIANLVFGAKRRQQLLAVFSDPAACLADIMDRMPERFLPGRICKAQVAGNRIVPFLVGGLFF
jgi:hypothetical protein